MRFQCRIGTGVPLAPPVLRAHPTPSALPPRRTAQPHRDWPARTAAAGAVMIAVAGCASFDTKVAKPWRVEPVFNVTNPSRSDQGYLTLGQYFEGSGDWAKAIDAYRKAIAADAKNVEAYNALGVVLARSGRHADAEITLRQAVALAPDRAHILNNLGYVLLLAGKPEAAVVALRAAVERDAGNARATANLRDALARVGGTPSDVLAATPTRPAPAATAVTAVTPVSTPAPAMTVGFAPEPAQPARSVDTPTLHTPTPTPATPAIPAATTAPQLPASRLEVSNGNGATGMAAKVGRWLATQGIPASRLSNHQPFTQQQTVVQYREGFEQAAQRVAEAMPAAARVDARPTRGLRGDVRVVLGHDWVKSATCLGQDACRAVATTVAAVAP